MSVDAHKTIVWNTQSNVCYVVYYLWRHEYCKKTAYIRKRSIERFLLEVTFFLNVFSTLEIIWTETEHISEYLETNFLKIISVISCIAQTLA